ncbi:MAG: hypothetical protein WAM14_14865 [Candidatus Nitrosopolaris sp.]
MSVTSPRAAYYANMEYNDKKILADGLPDEDVTTIEENPVYSINKSKPRSLAVLKKYR